MHDANDQSCHTADAISHSVLAKFLDRYPSIRFLRLQWQDLSGLLRARVVPVEQGRLIAMGKKAMRLSPCSLNLAVENSVLPAGSLVGGDTGFPDWSSLRTRQLLDPLYATVMCRISRNSAPGTHEREPRDDHCPRRALTTILNKASRQFKMEFLVGFEVEFEIFECNPEGKLVPHSLGLGGGACSGLRDPCYRYVEEVMKVLLEAGVGLEAIHTEGLQGQYEFCLAPRPPIEAVDELILVHDTLKRVFTLHGLVATMFPRPTTLRTQSIGQHTHVSISNPELEESFLAGILRNLPSLSALCLPYELSYERLKPGQAGGQFVAWGTEDRRVPIRKVKPGHWEIRCVDATANMYLALAATLSAGLLGCANGEPLRLGDSATGAQIGGTSLPHSLEAALNQLDEDDEEKGIEAVERFMESKVIRHYLNLKRFELLKLNEMEIEEARNWLVKLF
ncbi:fluG protein [Penicillium longicatenatum]|uniref:fluG protein n=1 Tax=Penicillium longicatenatum TaxID=1561947 RepID=UPI00254994A0|nr:fluG protein [Penicillium longicatenatum]KAJ5649330.1 fluG protein [Penicillium longicatenatum]